MPLYEYQCKQCGRRTEKILKFSDPPLTVCPHCGGELEQVLHAPAVSFKGGGWYADLYSSGKPSSSAEQAKAGEAAPAPASGDSSGASPAKESAPASTSASAPAASPAPASNSNTK